MRVYSTPPYIDTKRRENGYMGSAVKNHDEVKRQKPFAR